ncbi:hypothetical protein GCM10009569_07620 [Arthrobacter russicus]
MFKRPLKSVATTFVALGLVLGGVLAASPANGAQAPTPQPVDTEVQPRGPWWAEIQAFISCNNPRPAYNANAWDLSANRTYRTIWAVGVDGSGEWDVAQQYINSGSNGILTTSTFWAGVPASGYNSAWATVYLYDGNQKVGESTARCTR